MYRMLATTLILVGVALAQTADDVNHWLPVAQHDANAAFWLGVAYERGLGVSQDSAKALAWFLWSAMGRNADAQNAVGQIYEEGRGIKPEDFGQAEKGFLKVTSPHQTLGQCRRQCDVYLPHVPCNP